MTTLDAPTAADIAANATAEWASLILAMTSPVAEATAGYRAQLEAKGFSVPTAEYMATQFHAQALARFWATFGAGVK